MSICMEAAVAVIVVMLSHHISIFFWHFDIVLSSTIVSFLQLTGNYIQSMPCIFHVLMEMILLLCPWRLDRFQLKNILMQNVLQQDGDCFKITNQVKDNHQGILNLATEWDQDKTKCVGVTLLIINKRVSFFRVMVMVEHFNILVSKKHIENWLDCIVKCFIFDFIMNLLISCLFPFIAIICLQQNTLWHL